MKIFKYVGLAILHVFLSCSGESRIGLTLIPPGTITDKVDLDIRAGIVNQGNSSETYGVSIYLDEENDEALLHYSSITLGSGEATAVKYVMKTEDLDGWHRIILDVTTADGKNAGKISKDFEVIESDIRSTRLIDGAWAGIYHWSEEEGKK